MEMLGLGFSELAMLLLYMERTMTRQLKYPFSRMVIRHSELAKPLWSHTTAPSQKYLYMKPSAPRQNAEFTITVS